MKIFLCCILIIIARISYAQVCPGYENHPLVLVSLDGFRAEYLQRGLTPNIQNLIDGGVSVPHMISSFPSVTYPNHYSIVTGLNPASHGIVANNFFDPTFDDGFYIGDMNGTWWGGEPIWNTVVKQDKLSATMFWPGSDADIQDMRPTYYYAYDGSVTYETRVQQVLLWLSLPESSRPQFICVYFDEPDHTGHSYGPDSSEVNDTLAIMDSVISDLVSGIANLNITDCVNLIILADHGMTQSGSANIIELTDYVPDIENMAYTYEGAVTQIDIYDDYKNETDNIRRNLTSVNPHMRQYIPSGLPKRLHYSNNDRIGDIVLNLELGYLGNVNSDFYLSGEHGYDDYYVDMHPIFLASGPDFQKGVQVETFQNIELYNLMCLLVGVAPAPNNGTEAALNHLLQVPPSYPSVPPENPPPSPVYPSANEIDERMHLSGCPGDDAAPLSLNFSSADEQNLVSKHLPWGIPHSGGLAADLLLLSQSDHVTGYSQSLRMPLWTSFTIENDIAEPPITDWSSDVRLMANNTPTCAEYQQFQQINVSMQPLFPNRFGSDSAVNFIVSNAVPLHKQLEGHWDYLIKTLLPQWITGSLSPLNVIIGPAFDLNSDSLVDNFTTFMSNITIPSHVFVIATHCITSVTQLNDCPSADLDSLAFIYLQFFDIENIISEDLYALENSAKVKDVELLTGLTFFPDLPYRERTALITRIHSSLWSPVSELNACADFVQMQTFKNKRQATLDSFLHMK